MSDPQWSDPFAQLRTKYAGFAMYVFLFTWLYLHIAHRGFLSIFSLTGLGGLVLGMFLFPLTLGLVGYGLMRAVTKFSPAATPAGFFVVTGILLFAGMVWAGVEATRAAFYWAYP